MKMESVSHCDERSLLAPQRQQIMSILQVTVFWVTAFFFFFFFSILFLSVTPSHPVMSPEVSRVKYALRAAMVANSSWTARPDGSRLTLPLLFALFFFLLSLKLHSLKCGVMTLCALQVAHLH